MGSPSRQQENTPFWEQTLASGLRVSDVIDEGSQDGWNRAIQHGSESLFRRASAWSERVQARIKAYNDRYASDSAFQQQEQAKTPAAIAGRQRDYNEQREKAVLLAKTSQGRSATILANPLQRLR